MHGGARTRSGPTANPNALRRQRDAKTFTSLPRECTLPTPDWPHYMADPGPSEHAMWCDLWTRPQAHVWHADRLVESVALYVRQFVEAQKPYASAVVRVNVRQLADTLLLSSASLTRERYVITGSAEDEILRSQDGARRPGARTAAKAPRPSARSRMNVVPFDRGDASSTSVEDLG